MAELKAYSKLHSRKLWFAIGTSFLIIGCGFAAAYIPGFRPIFETTVGGLLGSLGLFSGSAVGAKYLEAVKGKGDPRSPKARTRASDKDAKGKDEADVPQGE